MQAVTTLAERLGYAPDARLLIINCDDLGSTRSANVAVYAALRNGVATSATLMVPCPWARDAAAQYRGEDVGVHLTLNAGVGDLPLGAAHPLAEPARRRRRVPAHRRGHLGPRRPRGGAPGVPGPDRAGDRLGLRREPPRQPHGDPAAPARVLRRLPRARGRLRPAAAHGRRAAPSGRRLPLPAARRARRASSSPTTSCCPRRGPPPHRADAVRPAARA